MEFKIEKLDKYTLIQVMEEKLDTNVAPSLIDPMISVISPNEKLSVHRYFLAAVSYRSSENGNP